VQQHGEDADDQQEHPQVEQQGSEQLQRPDVDDVLTGPRVVAEQGFAGNASGKKPVR
jgi:hypothetical protein